MRRMRRVRREALRASFPTWGELSWDTKSQKRLLDLYEEHQVLYRGNKKYYIVLIDF